MFCAYIMNCIWVPGLKNTQTCLILFIVQPKVSVYLNLQFDLIMHLNSIKKNNKSR